MSPHSSQPASLEDRLIHFLSAIPGAEAIDQLVPQRPNEPRKADFFFHDRTVICEMKNLVTDTSSKIEPLLRAAQLRDKVPLYWSGVVPLSALLKHFPDPTELNRQIATSITLPIREGFESANRQIRHTKRTFNLPYAGGLVIFGNESVPNVSPTVLAWSVNYMLTKRTPEGELRYPEINAVWMIVENHFVELPDGSTAIPSFTMRQEMVADPAAVGPFANSLQMQWAQLHAAKIVQSSHGNIAEMQFRKRPAGS